MSATNPGYFLSRTASTGGFTELYQSNASSFHAGGTGRSRQTRSSRSLGTAIPATEGEIIFKPCNSRITAEIPKARCLVPSPENNEKPEGWTLPRYSASVVAPETIKRVGNDFPHPASDLEHVDQLLGWSPGCKRYGGPQVTRYVPDAYSYFVRPSRAPVMRSNRAPGEKWMHETGRRAGSCPAEPADYVPDGWAVPRYSPLFHKIGSKESSFASQSEGSNLSGVSSKAPRRLPTPIPEDDKPKEPPKPSMKAVNPIFEMKKAAQAAARKRAEQAGDGVDMPDGWNVPRYAANVKKAGISPDEMMKADGRGRASCITNIWWGLPKQAASMAVEQGHAGASAAFVATREGRGLTLTQKPRRP